MCTVFDLIEMVRAGKYVCYCYVDNIAMVLVFGNRVLQHVRWTGKLGTKIMVSSCTILNK